MIKHENENYYKISEVVEITGEKKSTIQHYINEGMITEIYHKNKNMAYYNEFVIYKIKYINYLKENFKYTTKELVEIFQNTDKTYLGKIIIDILKKEQEKFSDKINDIEKTICETETGKRLVDKYKKTAEELVEFEYSVMEDIFSKENLTEEQRYDIVINVLNAIYIYKTQIFNNEIIKNYKVIEGL